MTQPQNNNISQSDNQQPSLTEKLFVSLIENLSQALGKILWSSIIIGIIIFFINNHNDLFSLVGFELGDPHILIPLGVSTGLVFFLTTMLSTPVSVAVGVALIIYLIFDQFNPF